MNEVIKFLNENPIQYFATIGLDNKPKIRPFQFMLEDNNKLYFCTSNQKEIYKELQKILILKFVYLIKILLG